MSISIKDLDFATAKESLARIDRILGDFGFAAPENSVKMQDLLNKLAVELNRFATSMCIIKPRSQQQ